MSSANKPRIVMVVNNAATTDNRVVKSAQISAREGFDCHVVGISMPGYKSLERIDGVTYHRVDLKYGPVSLLVGYYPEGVRLLERFARRRPSPYSSTVPGEGMPEIGEGKPRKENRLLRYKIMRRIFGFHPAKYTIGVRAMMGAYLRSFYPRLIELNADIYHAHELWTLQSCALAAERLGKPLVYDSHELEAHRNNTWRDASNRVRLTYEQNYIKSADLVMSVSEGCVETIKKLYALSRVDLLRNTPLLASQTRSKICLRSEIGLADDVPLLVYTGSVTVNRGLELVLAALAELTQFHLVTVGPWNEAVRSALLDYAKEIGVADRFHMHEKVPAEELIDFISAADLAVIPIQDACLSYRYCMPNKLFEAAFSGLPVVVSNLPDMARYVGDNHLGLTFESDDCQSLVAAIRRVYENRDEFVSAEKVEAIRSRDCFEHEADVFVGAYRRLSAETPVRAGN